MKRSYKTTRQTIRPDFRNSKQVPLILNVRNNQKHLVVILNQALACLEIRLHHLLDQRIKIDLTLPAK